MSFGSYVFLNTHRLCMLALVHQEPKRIERIPEKNFEKKHNLVEEYNYATIISTPTMTKQDYVCRLSSSKYTTNLKPPSRTLDEKYRIKIFHVSKTATDESLMKDSFSTSTTIDPFHLHASNVQNIWFNVG